VVGILLQVIKAPVLTLYNVSPEVIQNASTILLVSGIFLAIRINNMTVVVGILRAGGDTKFSMFLDGIVIWIVGVPLAALGAFVFGFPVYFVYLCAMVEEMTKWFLGHLALPLSQVDQQSGKSDGRGVISTARFIAREGFLAQ
jgi:Na+-driven multidrug efflux pump